MNDTIVSRRGAQTLRGKVLDKSFTITGTAYGTITVRTKSIAQILFNDPGNQGRDVIHTDADKLTGEISAEVVNFKPEGRGIPKRQVPQETIVAILFGK